MRQPPRPERPDSTCGSDSAPLVSNVQFTSATRADRREGLLGFLTFYYGELLVSGVALRRTLAGELRFSWPRRIDSSGEKRHYMRPRDDESRRAIEKAVLSELGFDRDPEESRP